MLGPKVNARRSFVRALGATLLAAPLGSFAQQQGKAWRIGFLSPRRRPASLDSDYYGAFPRRMSELGYVEGRNLTIEWRFANGEYERLPGMATELVQLKVDAIMALGPPGVIAAKNATTRIPIIMVVSVDPVGAGLVKSLAQPGGNITGLSNLAGDLSAKHLELLRTTVPRLSRVALLVNPANAAHAAILKNVQAAAQKSGIEVLAVEARTLQEHFPGWRARTPARSSWRSTRSSFSKCFRSRHTRPAFDCHPYSRFAKLRKPAGC